MIVSDDSHPFYGEQYVTLTSKSRYDEGVERAVGYMGLENGTPDDRD
ncbi:hypothetical protein [Halorussus litoreus]|nr:hypothetical protein [Halorussus litoreus]